MEQWMKDGRHMLFERWQTETSGVAPNKLHPERVAGVDDAVLRRCLAVFARNRHHACVASQLLRSDLCRASDDDDNNNELDFKFADGVFARGIDRSGFFGLVQRGSTNSQQQSVTTATLLTPKPHARVLVDYGWAFRGRIYDWTSDFSFIAGAGVVPQALEEAVLYVAASSSYPVAEALYEVAGSSSNPSASSSSSTPPQQQQQLHEGFSFDDFEEFLCDSAFAFRDEGTRLTATDFTIADDSKEKKRIAVKATEPPQFIPPGATVSLLVRVVRFCPSTSAAKHLELATRFKEAGNKLLVGGGGGEAHDEKKDITGARRWYERALLELSPEALRVSEAELSANPDSSAKPSGVPGEIRKTLASLSHNISLCWWEEATNSSSPDSALSSMDRRDLLRRSIRSASEAIKVSGGQHAKSFLRRAAAHAELGDFDEAEADLKAMEAASPQSAGDAAVVALRATMRERIKKADATWKGAFA